MKILRHTHSLRMFSLGVFTLAMSSFQLTMAAPGSLSNEPLQTLSSAEPNIMFLLDDSGSMETIVAETPYDPSVTYDADPDDAAVTACASPLAAGTEVRLHLTGGSYDTPQFTLGSGTTNYDLGNDSGEKCFDPTRDYTANLYTNTVGVRTGVAGARPYKGNYLNWYFDPDSTSGTWVQKKPGTNTRMEIAQTALSSVINDMAKVRVGLALFDGSSGADFKVHMDDLATNLGDASTSGSLLGEIATAVPGGSTPLAESLHSVGRYFAEGYCSGTNKLTLHPDDISGTEVDANCTTVLHNKRSSQSNTAPIQYFCQKSFAILLTDGDSKSDQGINSTSLLIDYDGDCSGTNSGNCISGTPNYDKKIAPAAYFSTGSDYLDDVAQALYEVDLRPDLVDNDGNEVTNNLVTYTIGFSAESVQNNTLLEDTATQGGGEFLQANNSADLISAFARAAKSIESKTSSSSAVTFNSSNLSSNSAVYQALFNTVRWSGEVNSFPLNPLTGIPQSNCSTGPGCWSAAAVLENQAHASREIMTYNSGKGVEFITPSNYTNLTSSTVPQALIDDLCQGVDRPFPCNGSETATEKAANQIYIGQIFDYLRGDRTQESQTVAPIFRTRTSILGDLINASPIFVGKPALARQRPGRAPYPTGDDAYSVWEATSVKDRTEVIYAAANDGMLHAIKATDGSELMAYVPSGTFSTSNTHGLHYLADPAYNHRFYVDLTPSISDVWMKHRGVGGTVTSDPAWRTVLLGGQRQGGRTLYLLDVTDPTKYSDVGTTGNEVVLWEFTHPDLGYSFSKPTIAMMNNGKFAAVFGNGYKSGEDGGTGDCRAKLFIVYLEGGLDGSWDAGDYKIIDTTKGATGGDDCNGLSSPTLFDFNKDGTVDKVYAGDLKGNMWSFDLCNYDTPTGSEACATDDTEWKIAYGTTLAPEPLMTAKDKASTAQPITVQPAVSLDPSGTGTDMIIAFGTGQYLTFADIADTQLQTIYGVREADALTNGGNSDIDPRSTGQGFKKQFLEIKSCSAQQTGCTIGRLVVQPPGGSNSRGWMIDLYDNVITEAMASGEKVFVNPKIRNNNLFINTLTPDGATCKAGGEGWLMAFNLADGNRPLVPVWDIDPDGVFDALDKIDSVGPSGIRKGNGDFGITGEPSFLSDNVYIPCNGDEICVTKFNDGEGTREGRMSWKEIFDED